MRPKRNVDGRSKAKVQMQIQAVKDGWWVGCLIAVLAVELSEG
jgi:hypothetical protein